MSKDQHRAGRSGSPFPPPTGHRTPTPPTVSPSAPAPTRRHRGVAAGLALGLIGGSAAGLVFGVPGLSNAAGDPAVSSPSALVQQADTTPDTTPDTGTDAERVPGERARAALQELVDDGTITAEQADAVIARLIDQFPRFAEGRPGPHPGQWGRHRRLARASGVASEAVTDLLGIDVATLREELRSGSTLAEVATAHGIEPQAVIDELVGEVQERLDAAVAEGHLTEVEAADRLAQVTPRIADRVNNGHPERVHPLDAGDTPPPPDAESGD